MLKMAGAAPLVEQVRLGAIQMRESLETDAEKTFEQAYKAESAKESRDLPEVIKLRLAAQKMYEELKLRRTLPDVFSHFPTSTIFVSPKIFTTQDESRQAP